MNSALVLNNVVASVVLTGDSAWLASVSQTYQYVVPLEDGSPIEAGWLYDGSNFIQPSQPVVINPTQILQDLYNQLQMTTIVAMAPYFGVFEAMLNLANYTGIAGYISQLVAGNNITSDQQSEINQILLNDGLDLSQY